MEILEGSRADMHPALDIGLEQTLLGRAAGFLYRVEEFLCPENLSRSWREKIATPM